ncbi:VWA domain-containing protein [Pseudoalteromonas sp. SSDWG2]|uniref:VWA domain-containing protein n=1 Tax=Pseudoalteromonas sp. SSDWG2 TaxID=3139391 RepID=UPI003BAAB369
MNEFVFLRPQALWLLLPVIFFCVWAIVKRSKAQQQGELIAAHLATQVMKETHQKQKSSGIVNALLLAIMVLALAGPSFSKKEVPVYEAKTARVIVMDMSRSMFATDISPSRLQQARFKALDMVALFEEGETALIAYAGDAYTISPLTSDVKTLDNLIPSLTPDIMPEQGSNVLTGLTAAHNLLEQADYPQGDVILITDGIDYEDESDIRDWLANTPHRLSIYALGSEQGAPISLPDGGFLKDDAGQIVIPKTDFDRLSRLANLGGGQLVRYQPSSDNLGLLANGENTQTTRKAKNQQTLWRIDAGIYLALLALPLLLIQIHRRAIMVCAVCVLFPWQGAHAANWQSWFKNNEQNALHAYAQKEYEQASASHNPLLRGAALYQQQDYQAALSEFNKDASASGLYNQGNALAQLGQIDEAIERYRQALEINPNLHSAATNKTLLEQLKNQQQDQKQNGEQGDQNQSQQDQGSEQQQGQQQGQQQTNDQQQDNGTEQNSQQQSSSDSDNQQRNDAQQNAPQNSAQTTEQDDDATQSEQDAQQQSASDPTMKADDEQPQTSEQDAESSQQQPQDTQQGEHGEGQSEQQVALADAQLSPEEREKMQQLNQLLRKIPDEPEILLRNKMQLEAQKRQRYRRRLPQGEEKSW